MTIAEGTALIETARIDWAKPQRWCDLGCGTGLFTRALAGILAQGSTIHAVDRSANSLRALPDEYNGSRITRCQGDLTDQQLRLPECDGMLLANVLHFLANREQLLRRLSMISRYLLVVEYERRQITPWGPYPMPYDRLCLLSQAAGF